MEYYRIKKIIRCNGEVEYIPQVGFSKMPFFGPYLSARWENIIGDNPESFYSTFNSYTSYKSYGKVITILMDFEKSLKDEKGKKVKKIKYINLF